MIFYLLLLAVFGGLVWYFHATLHKRSSKATSIDARPPCDHESEMCPHSSVSKLRPEVGNAQKISVNEPSHGASEPVEERPVDNGLTDNKKVRKPRAKKPKNPAWEWPTAQSHGLPGATLKPGEPLKPSRKRKVK
jgi:hypothetical protein